MRIKLLVACREEQLALCVLAPLIQSAAPPIDGAATDLARLLPTAAAMRPDVLMLEYTAGEDELFRSVPAQLAEVCGTTRVLLLCDAYSDGMIVDFVEHGVSGCLLKSSDAWVRAKAVGAVHRGEPWFGRAALLQALRTRVAAKPAVGSAVLDNSELLTARERDILALIGNAMSNKEIARVLKISDHTVKTHLHHIYVKLHKSGRYKAFLSNAGLSLH
jgi:DNA-binding NarL/FixJ family response regulator